MKTSTKTKIVIGELPSADITQLTLHSELCAVTGGTASTAQTRYVIAWNDRLRRYIRIPEVAIYWLWR
jgi:hypothetical protein